MVKPKHRLEFLSTLTLLMSSILVYQGCGHHPWYLVEWSYSQALTDRGPEITSNEKYDKLRTEFAAIAIDAPDRCADRSSAETTGEAAKVGGLLSANCGVEMAELERALARASYRVISWNAVRALVLRKNDITPLEAARSLGADILLHVNSLETAVALPGRDERFKENFYQSDRAGKKGAVAKVPERRAQALEQELRKLDSMSYSRSFVSVSIDATAVFVRTGEAIWFYRWTHSATPASRAAASQLFVCNRRNLDLCFPRQPAGSAGKKQDESPRSGRSGEVLTEPESADQTDALYHRLVNEVLDSLVSDFRSGRGGGD